LSGFKSSWCHSLLSFPDRIKSESSIGSFCMILLKRFRPMTRQSPLSNVLLGLSFPFFSRLGASPPSSRCSVMRVKEGCQSNGYA
jgi:hypothetical protein